ncbi:MAG: hypothetical protein J6D06_04985 [Clostridia bacterium]|nr:hypothetical protein [Clostridia bacterium]
MNILFENQYLRDESLVKELYQYLYFKRGITKACFALMGITVVINIVNGVTLNQFDIVALFFPLLFAFFIFYRYFRDVKLSLKRDAECCSDGLWGNVVVTDEGIIRSFSTGDLVRLSFDKFKYVTETKNLILLFSETGLITILRKDSFLKGDSCSFVSFLSAKGVKIK